MTHEQIKALPTDKLRSIVASTNPTGTFAAEVVWARAELNARARAKVLKMAAEHEEDPRCVRCRFIVRSYESMEDGHCAHCRGVSSFIVSPAVSKVLADEFATRKESA